MILALKLRRETGGWEEKKGLLSLFEPEFFEEKRMIAAVGAGGKTTFLFRLGEELKAIGKKVVVLTTTRMMPEPDYVIYPEVVEDGIKMFEKRHLIQIGKREEKGKFGFPEENLYEAVIAVADVILYEADGSKRLPLKYPRGNEPVYLPATDRVVVLSGLSSLDQPLNRVCHRVEAAVPVLKGVGIPSENVTEEVIACLMDKGYPNNPDNAIEAHRFIALVNQGDDDVRVARGQKVIESLDWPIGAVVALNPGATTG